MWWCVTIWAKTVYFWLSHCLLTYNSIGGLFWKALSMKERKVRIEPFCIAGTILHALYLSSHFTLTQMSKVAPNIITCISQVRRSLLRWSQLLETTPFKAGKWLPSALSDCLWPSPTCLLLRACSGTSSLSVTWELVRDAQSLVPPQICLKQNLHFNQMPWFAIAVKMLVLSDDWEAVLCMHCSLVRVNYHCISHHKEPWRVTILSLFTKCKYSPLIVFSWRVWINVLSFLEEVNYYHIHWETHWNAALKKKKKL